MLPARLVHSEFPTPRDGKTRAYIHPYTLSVLTNTRYIPFDPKPDPPRSDWWCACARLLEPPKDSTDIVKSSNGNSTKSSAGAERKDEAEGKVLHPGSKENAGAKGDEGDSREWEVWLGISDRVLETHVMFVGEMQGDLGDWDLIRCVASFSSLLVMY